LTFVGASAATCFWVSRTAIVATLGRSATIVPGDSVVISSEAGIRSGPCGYQDCSCWNATSNAVEVEAPNPPVLVSAAVEAPTSVGICSSLVVSAAGSSGGGGRDLTYSWSVNVSEPSANCTARLLKVALGATASSAVATLPRAAVEPCAGATLSASVEVSNFFGERSVVTKSVKVLHGAAPEIKIVGGSDLRTLASRKIQLRADAKRVSCDGEASTSSSLSFLWTVSRKERGKSSFGLAPASTRSDPRVYELNPFSLSAGDELALTVTVFDGPINNSAVGTLIVEPSDLVAVIEGGDRTVDQLSDLILDASSSYDPDDLGHLIFLWT